MLFLYLDSKKRYSLARTNLRIYSNSPNKDQKLGEWEIFRRIYQGISPYYTYIRCLYGITMLKAAVYAAFDFPIQIKYVSKSTLRDEHSVFLQVMATGVYRSNWYGWKEHDDDIRHHGLLFIPGHEVFGIVLKKGTSVREIQTCDRVAVPFILSCGICFECQLSHPTVCLRQEQPGFATMGSFAE